MKTIIKIFIRDLKNIIKNPAAIVVITGLCFIPALYAWVNIIACWNPYVNTGNIPVAVINKDQGAVIEDNEINVGDDIVKELKKNTAIGWRFVDDWQGNYKLNEGEYYALIEIPSNFSKNLTTLVTKTPVKPDIVYKVNEKANAIATKITGVAKDKLTKQIKDNFVKAVNQEAFTILNKLGGELETNKPQILQIKGVIESAQENLDDIINHINTASTNAKGLENYLGTVKNSLPNITNEINSIQNITDASKTLINETKNTFNNGVSNLGNDISKMQSLSGNIESYLNTIKNLKGNDTQLIKDKINYADKLNNILDNILKYNISLLETLNTKSPNNIIGELIGILKNTETLITNEKDQLNKLKELINSNAEFDKINNQVDSAVGVIKEISAGLINLSAKYYSNGIGVLNNFSNTLEGGMDITNSVLENTKVIVPQLNALANYGIASNKLVGEQTKKLADSLETFQGNLTDLKDKTKILTEENLNTIIDLMERNPKIMAEFMASPIGVKEVEVYDAGIFGVGLTPFYTVLGIWVGVLILTSLLTTECYDFENGEKIGIIQGHFGKMLLFLFISLIQTLIVTLGDKYVIGVKPQNMALLLAFAILSSITFTVIIFTLVSLFGNVGKGIVVLIMVFQIAGAGGIYPIQTNPELFKILHPFWPFTYAIDGFREAIAGPLWSNVYRCFKALIFFNVAFLLLTVLKKPFFKVTEVMQSKFKESGM